MKKIHLSIPEPCHEDWEKMTPAGRGRFCSSCKKTVMDFSVMSDRELVAFFKKPAIDLCGRFNQGQLDHALIIPRKRIPWVKYLFQFTWPAFVFLLKSCGWKEKTTGKPAVNTEDVRNRFGSNRQTIATLGTLATGIHSVDTRTDGDQMEDASFKGDIEITETDEVHNSIGMPDIEKQTDSTCEMHDNDNTGTDTTVISQNEMDTVFVVSDSNVRRRKISGAVCVITSVTTAQEDKQNRRGEKESLLSLYPNPVSKGGLLKLNLWLEKGEYVLLLLTGSGQMVQKEKVFVEFKSQVLNFRLKEVPAGTYFVRLMNSKTGRAFTEKLIVQ
jgi:hypothetical protein